VDELVRGGCGRNGLLQLFLEFGPAGEELVERAGGLLHLRLGGDQRGGIGLDGGIVERGLRGPQAGFGIGDLLLDGGMLARLLVGELALGGRRARIAIGLCRNRRRCGRSTLLFAPLLPLRVIGKSCGVAVAIEAEHGGRETIE